MKKIYYTSLIFVAILLTCTAIPLVQAATHSSMTWGHTYYPTSYPNPLNDPLYLRWLTYEQPAQNYTASYITSLVSQAGPNWVGTNNYGSSTTATNVYNDNGLINILSWYDFIATFHVSDFYLQPISGTYHYAYYGSSGTSNAIIDKDLFSYTGTKNKFTFIWTCANGWVNYPSNTNYYYYTDTQNSTGIVGMAYAWTHKTNLSTIGYYSPDNNGVTYIGFENTSKWLSDNSDFRTYNYGDFCRTFYSNLFNHDSVNTSLNKATAYTMGGSQYNFMNTVLYSGYWESGSFCRMRVLGDGNMVLPY